MKAIILCNTGADSLSKISLNDESVNKIVFAKSEKPIGPQGIVKYKDGFITANNYSDSVSFFNNSYIEEKNVKIGVKPNDLIISKDKLYTVCGESNTVVVYDLIEEKITLEIETDNWPHSICKIEEKGLIFVSNLDGNNVTIISENSNSIIRNIYTPEYPTKLLVSTDNRFLFVCESYLGDDKHGYLEVFSTSNFNSIKRIKVGSSPIDMFQDNEKIYVTNFTDGSISVISKNSFSLERNIYIGGMPKGIIKNNNKLYVADYLKGRVYVLEDRNIKKIIAVESEPNAMMFI